MFLVPIFDLSVEQLLVVVNLERGYSTGLLEASKLIKSPNFSIVIIERL